VYPPNKGSLAGCEPLVRFEPRTHRLRGWIVDFPSQVPRRLLEFLEQYWNVENTIVFVSLRNDMLVLSYRRITSW